MFVQALFTQAVDPNAFLVPQPAVQRDIGGDAFVFVVGPGNKAVRRKVVADRTFGADWVVTGGLTPGDKVITQGTANLKTGRQIRPVPRTRRSGSVPPSPAARRRSARRRHGGRRLSLVADLHRPADLRLGHRDRHHAGRDSARSVSLPIEQYPDIAPPQVNIRATYPGASAETIENSVTQIIEQQLTGIDGLLYFTSSSSSRGSVEHLGDLRQGHRPRHRPGPGPEQGPAGDLAPAAAGAAAGRPGHQVQPRLPADRRGLRRDRPAHEHGRLRLSGVQYPGPAVARRRASATSTCSARRTRCASGSTRSGWRLLS